MNRIPFSVLPVEQQHAYSKEDLVAYILKCEQIIARKNDKLFLIREQIYFAGKSDKNRVETIRRIVR